MAFVGQETVRKRHRQTLYEVMFTYIQILIIIIINNNNEYLYRIALQCKSTVIWLPVGYCGSGLAVMFHVASVCKPCCCILSGIVAQSLKPVKLLSYVETDATTPNIFGPTTAAKTPHPKE